MADSIIIMSDQEVSDELMTMFMREALSVDEDGSILESSVLCYQCEYCEDSLGLCRKHVVNVKPNDYCGDRVRGESDE